MIRINIEKKKIYILSFVLIITMFFSIFGVSKYINYLNNKEMIYFANKTLEKIEEKYPDISDEVIKEIFITSNNTKEYENILSKYGIDDTNINIEYTDSISKNKKVEIFLFIFTGIFSLIYISIFIFFEIRENIEYRRLEKYIDNILNNKYDVDIRDNAETKISKLKNKIYKITVMLKENNELLKEEKNLEEKFLSDISHQIKTPLTSLNIINDVLYDDLNREDKVKFLKVMSDELNKIEWLIKNLLSIAKLKSKTLKLNTINMNIHDVIKESIKTFDTLSELLNVKINIQNDEEILFNVDRKWMIEAFNNLIKNAIEHGSKNINISYSSNRLYNEIIIEDDGEGIDEADIPNIFKRFYKAKNSKSESVGLGLSFVKEILNFQKMDIMVKSKKNIGTSFYIKQYIDM